MVDFTMKMRLKPEGDHPSDLDKEAAGLLDMIKEDPEKAAGSLAREKRAKLVKDMVVASIELRHQLGSAVVTSSSYASFVREVTILAGEEKCFADAVEDALAKSLASKSIGKKDSALDFIEKALESGFDISWFPQKMRIRKKNRHLRPKIAKIALSGLEKGSDPDALLPLILLIGDSGTPKKIIEVIDKRTGISLEPLVRALSSEDNGVRDRAIEVLYERAGGREVPGLLGLVAEGPAHAAVPAMEILSYCWDREPGCVALGDALKALRDRDPKNGFTIEDQKKVADSFTMLSRRISGGKGGLESMGGPTLDGMLLVGKVPKPEREGDMYRTRRRSHA